MKQNKNHQGNGLQKLSTIILPWLDRFHLPCDVSEIPLVPGTLAEIISFFYDYYHTEGLPFREAHCLLQECVITPLLNRPAESFLVEKL